MSSGKSRQQELLEQFDYLSREMQKFILKNDIDTVLDLGRQRDIFEKELIAVEDKSYAKTPEGQALLRKICQQNRELIGCGERWLNSSRNSHKISSQYESLGYSSSGLRLDKSK